MVLPIQEWEGLAENLLAAANHADTPKLRRTLNRLEEKITSVVAVNEPAADPEPSITTKDWANIDASITACWEWIAAWANTADQLKAEHNGRLISYSDLPVMPQPLSQQEREQLVKLDALPLRLRRKLRKVEAPLGGMTLQLRVWP